MPNTAIRRRPYMRDYGIAGGDEGLMSWDWVDAQMTKSRNYWIGTTRPDGRPHAAPVWGVWFEGALYFSSGEESRKARNFAQQPEIVAHLESGDNVVILEGRVERTTDPDLLTRVNALYLAKYPPYDMSGGTGVVAFCFSLRPRVALAWQEHDFPNTATRWDFPR